ncbi:SinI family restriction endonuclease [Planktothrix mougeotii]|uniref:SinI family restriction endonuclease n=1 Tax=Planktothrix mougeotii LEGE 06226 TaxID=1828728 RepID=A0ABR9U8K1_9CYAN|nr:SinI family restriction endonuclease [Planktothrix mougeotii]MBE9142767.1 SinI family restriction endonuclease [Planktothrix mougeotii LEGE 06226]
MHENSIDSSDLESQIFRDYENFKEENKTDIQIAMKEAMLDPEHKEKVCQLLFFINQFPKLLTKEQENQDKSDVKTKKEDTTEEKKSKKNDVKTEEKTTQQKFIGILKKYQNGRKEANLKIRKELEIGGTIPDQMVRLILQKSEECTDEEAEAHINSHILAMSAENLLGSLLERYIAGVIENHGWIWCRSEIILATDFIKFPTPPQEKWICLQVKNGDNTENSSSSKIREIFKDKDYKDRIDSKLWCRSYSKWELKRDSLKNNIYEKLGIEVTDKSKLKKFKEKLKKEPNLKHIKPIGNYQQWNTWIDLARQLGFNDLVNPPDKRNTNWDELNKIIGLLGDDSMSEEKLEKYISDLYNQENHE